MLARSWIVILSVRLSVCLSDIRLSVTRLLTNFTPLPISLLSIFHKLLEKLMFKRVYSFSHKFSVLYQYQFAFRQYHLTSLALTELCDNLYSNLDQCISTFKKPLIQYTTKFYLKICITTESGELSMIGFEITYQIVDSLLLWIILILTLVMLILVSRKDLSWVLYYFNLC